MTIVLALDPYGDDHVVEADILAGRGIDVVAASGDDGERTAQLAEAVALLVVDSPVDDAVLSAAPRCRIVATYGVGVDNIDLEAARAAGVVVANVPDYCQDEVADHTVALWLTCERRIARADAMVRAGDWDGPALGPFRRLRGLTFGLIGLGRISREVARRVRGFGVRVVAFDPAVSQVDDDLDFVELRASIEEVASDADVLSVHVPLSPDTRHLVNATVLQRLRPGAVVLNTARGGLVDESALFEALRSGRLRGAGIDVLEREPPRGLDIDKLSTLVLSPHIAFMSEQSVIAAKQGTATAIADVLDGRAVTHRVA